MSGERAVSFLGWDVDGKLNPFPTWRDAEGEVGEAGVVSPNPELENSAQLVSDECPFPPRSPSVAEEEAGRPRYGDDFMPNSENGDEGESDPGEPSATDESSLMSDCDIDRFRLNDILDPPPI